MDVKKLMWAYLIKHGTTKEFSYYGGRYAMGKDRYRENHLKILREISRDGVDWGKTKEPRDDTRAEFAGTFADEPAYVKVIEGTLVTNKGKKYDFGAEWDEPVNAFVIVAELSTLDFDDILKQKCLNKKS